MNTPHSNSRPEDRRIFLWAAMMSSVMAGLGCCPILFFSDDDATPSFPQSAAPAGAAAQNGEAAPAGGFAPTQ